MYRRHMAVRIMNRRRPLSVTVVGTAFGSIRLDGEFSLFLAQHRPLHNARRVRRVARPSLAFCQSEPFKPRPPEIVLMNRFLCTADSTQYREEFRPRTSELKLLHFYLIHYPGLEIIFLENSVFLSTFYYFVPRAMNFVLYTV